MTGFGNTILPALIASGHEVKIVVTRKELGPFPHYSEIDFAKQAKDLGCQVCFELPEIERLKSEGIQVLLSATFHKFIPVHLIQAVDLAINLHPSLLPSYRGASPVYWVIRNGESITGLTVHMLTSKLDDGDILAQEKVQISPIETQGSLRKKLAQVAPSIILKVLDDYVKKRLQPRVQEPHLVSFFPKFSLSEHVSPLGLTCPNEIDRLNRALTPWPGARLSEY